MFHLQLGRYRSYSAAHLVNWNFLFKTSRMSGCHTVYVFPIKSPASRILVALLLRLWRRQRLARAQRNPLYAWPMFLRGPGEKYQPMLKVGFQVARDGAKSIWDGISWFEVDWGSTSGLKLDQNVRMSVLTAFKEGKSESSILLAIIAPKPGLSRGSHLYGCFRGSLNYLLIKIS